MEELTLKTIRAQTILSRDKFTLVTLVHTCQVCVQLHMQSSNLFFIPYYKDVEKSIAKQISLRLVLNVSFWKKNVGRFKGSKVSTVAENSVELCKLELSY